MKLIESITDGNSRGRLGVALSLHRCGLELTDTVLTHSLPGQECWVAFSGMLPVLTQRWMQAL